MGCSNAIVQILPQQRSRLYRTLTLNLPFDERNELCMLVSPCAPPLDHTYREANVNKRVECIKKNRHNSDPWTHRSVIFSFLFDEWQKFANHGNDDARFAVLSLPWSYQRPGKMSMADMIQVPSPHCSLIMAWKVRSCTRNHEKSDIGRKLLNSVSNPKIGYLLNRCNCAEMSTSAYKGEFL